MRKAHSLLELMVTLAIIAMMMLVSLPLLDGPIDDARFHAFSAELTGNLIYARRYAQVSHETLVLEFSDDPDAYYRCWIERDSGDRELLLLHSRLSRGGIALTLPEGPIPHPTVSRTLDRPLTSTHEPEVHFTYRGASASSICFSDGEERVFCAVISPNSGRIRTYLWNADVHDWLPFF